MIKIWTAGETTMKTRVHFNSHANPQVLHISIQQHPSIQHESTEHEQFFSKPREKILVLLFQSEKVINFCSPLFSCILSLFYIASFSNKYARFTKNVCTYLYTCTIYSRMRQGNEETKMKIVNLPPGRYTLN